MLETVHQRFLGRDVIAIAIAAEGSAAAVRQLVATSGVHIPVVLATPRSEIVHTFALKAVPTLFVIDRMGAICKQYVGMPNIATLSYDIEALTKRE